MAWLPAEGPARAATIYYLIATPLTVFVACSGLFRSGVCTPNFDVLLPFLYIVIACIDTLFQLARGIANREARRAHFRAAAVHGVMLIALFGLIALGSLFKY